MIARRPWWLTLVGVLLTAVMLFPVYWMINVSLTQTGSMRKDPPDWFPFAPTFSGYQAVLSEQLPYLGTSLIVGLGTVLLTVAIAAPAAYSLAKLRPRGGQGLSFVLLIAQMIPAIIMAMGFYAIYLNLGLLNSIRQYSTLNLNGFKPVRKTTINYPWQDFRNIRLERWKRQMFDLYRRRSYFFPPHKRRPFVLNREELATIYHFPGQVATTPSLEHIESKKAVPPVNLPI
jgi:ABC-type sugar transport system permease subunit